MKRAAIRHDVPAKFVREILGSKSKTARRKLRLGLTLGSGSARVWAHLGVIRELEAAGVRSDVDCGTSIGALVGGTYVVGELDRLEDRARTRTIKNVIAFMNFTASGGLVRGVRQMDHFRQRFTDRPIEQSAIPFAAVATALDTRAEVWLPSGSMFEAVRASVARCHGRLVRQCDFTPRLHVLTGLALGIPV